MTTAELLTQKIQSLPEPLQYQAMGYIDSLIEAWQQSTIDNSNLAKPTVAMSSIKAENQKLTVDEAFDAITIKTDKHATVEEMNESIAKAFENWQG